MNSTHDTTDFASRLLAWYDIHKRSLPWRERQSDAYAVWISEIMLQQTTVAAVVPFYERWMTSFPTVRSLAAAELDDVLHHWAGLGYYARARNIKRAAETIVSDFQGHLPDTVEGLLTLRGVGRYTAGAIASIAYGVRAPILDANVMRVYARVEALDLDIDGTAGQARLWQIAEERLPDRRCGDFNQALMELGATVCSPGAPRCGVCPVRDHCQAHRLGDPTTYPIRSKKTRWLDVEDCAVAVERQGTVLLVKRPSQGLWGGLWELPRTTREEGESLEACAVRAVGETVGMVARVTCGFGTVKHTVMNRRMRLYGFRGTVEASVVPACVTVVDARWIPISEIGNYPLASPQQALVALLDEQCDQGTLGL